MRHEEMDDVCHYDWIELADTPVGDLWIPAPYGDKIRESLLRSCRPNSFSSYGESGIRPKPLIRFLRNGKLVRQFNLYGDQINVDGRFYSIAKEQSAEVERLFDELIMDSLALNKAIEMGNPLQRVQAARALLHSDDKSQVAI